MSGTEDDEIASIREQKREQLAAKLETPAEPIHVESRDDLREKVDTHPVALVDFYADWCGPCQMLEPVVETIAEETDAAVLKVDVDEHQDIAREFDVSGVPTLYLFVDGEPAERLVGVQDEGSLRELVAQHT